MTATFTKALRRLALAAGLALPAIASAGYSQLYVLGDSLSDVGNVGATQAALVAANGGQPLPILGLADPNTPPCSSRIGAAMAKAGVSSRSPRKARPTVTCPRSMARAISSASRR